LYRSCIVGIEGQNLKLRLKEIREHRFLTQAELGRLSRVSRVTIARIELGIQEPRFTTINRIARALNVKPEDLIEVDPW
jgi:transcriptional regulator with XRE-family HTH domain